MRTVAVITAARSDFSAYQSVITNIKRKTHLKIKLIVTGTHLENKFGHTIDEIRHEGYAVDYIVPIHYGTDEPYGIAKSISSGVLNFAKHFEQFKPDILMLLGDRYEMLAAATASLPFNIPIAHLHGGESSEGVMDEAIRHAISKMSHLHFVSASLYRDRLIRMGEDPARVILSGAPALDSLDIFPFMSAEALGKELGIDFTKPTLIATYHPVTLELDQIQVYADEFIQGILLADMPTIITYPNADTFGKKIIKLIEQSSQKNKNLHVFKSLGRIQYFSALKYCQAMVGNSSSGIIEAASFKLPVVNVGNRQKGRVRAKNVIDAGEDKISIQNGIKRAVSKAFHESLTDLSNPYVHGNAGEIIASTLSSLTSFKHLTKKKFYDDI